eukprot:Cvel_18601.t1-p1 / transcript=Cvel_18601.t1 / gene=Cvel_18601 / organism=Chromera_velia_CCMP2878 / gene_product=hypothetical protein / transcript_product=hypothetical protein / location=Cvel_scaffold1552:3256-4195(+) / protein_length=313 / sequence_SO=supercontig / SO=protein_coding / is_pseudo=false
MSMEIPKELVEENFDRCLGEFTKRFGLMMMGRGPVLQTSTTVVSGRSAECLRYVSRVESVDDTASEAGGKGGEGREKGNYKGQGKGEVIRDPADRLNGSDTEAVPQVGDETLSTSPPPPPLPSPAAAVALTDAQRISMSCGSTVGVEVSSPFLSAAQRGGGGVEKGLCAVSDRGVRKSIARQRKIRSADVKKLLYLCVETGRGGAGSFPFVQRDTSEWSARRSVFTQGDTEVVGGKQESVQRGCEVFTHPAKQWEGGECLEGDDGGRKCPEWVFARALEASRNWRSSKADRGRDRDERRRKSAEEELQTSAGT